MTRYGCILCTVHGTARVRGETSVLRRFSRGSPFGPDAGWMPTVSGRRWLDGPPTRRGWAQHWYYTPYSCLPQEGSVPSGLGLGFEGGFHDGSELNV
jgi:hypothetical protein